MSAALSPTLVANLERRFGGVVDVQWHVRDVEDWVRRGGVARPDGLLVSRVVNDAKRRRAAARRARDAGRAAQERYAVLQVEVFRLVAQHALGPGAIAELLEASRANGFPDLNARTIERLRALGPVWPDIS